MKQETLEILKSFYRSQGNPVWILDENWQVLWGTCSYDYKKPLPELLDVPWNFWGQIQKKIFWNANCFDCTLNCSPQYQGRILTLNQSASPVNLPIDHIATANSVQSLKMITDQIEHNLHAKNIYDQDDFFSALRSVCYVIFRNPYIERLLNHIYSPKEKELLRISSELYEICKNTKPLLQGFAKIEFRMDDLDPKTTEAELNKNAIQNFKKEFLCENKTLFCAAVLCGILLCCQNPEQKQSIKISLNHHYTETEVEILISMTAMDELREDRKAQGSIQNYGDPIGEKMLLDMFCSFHKGTWRLSQSIDQKQITNHCSILLKSDQLNHLQFHSRKQKKFNPSFFDVYHVLLARICVADISY